MDGYAVRAADTRGANRQTPKRLRVLRDLPAGYVTGEKVLPGTAMRIMTGAALPSGADGVVEVEKTESGEQWVDVFAEVPRGQYIRPAGEDVKQGTRVFERGTIIRPQEVGMLAALARPWAGSCKAVSGMAMSTT